MTEYIVEPTEVTVETFVDDTLVQEARGVMACPEQVLVAARGSGQNTPLKGAAYAQGLGSRGSRVWGLLHEARRLTCFEFPAIAVDYPAVAVGVAAGGALELGNHPRMYATSVDAGVTAASTAVLRTLIACPDIRMTLFGYSQGAQVIGNAFAELPDSAREQVERVLLFADPLYTPGDPAVSYLPTPLEHSGIKGTREPFPPGPTVIESWCWHADMICQRPPAGTAFHGSEYDRYEQEAAVRAASASDRD